jgi:predicted phage-related endonuclease
MLEALLVPDEDPIRARWLEARARGPAGYTLGGSDLAAMLGWSPWTTPFELFCRKLGLLEREPMSDDQEAGLFFEDAILRWYARRTRRPVVKPDLVAATMLLDELTARGVGMMHGAPGDAAQDFESSHDEQLDVAMRLVADAKPALEQQATTIGRRIGEHAVVHYGPDVDGRVVFRHRKRPWQTMSPDAFALRSDVGWGVVDAKNLSREKAHEWKGQVPPVYSPQIADYTSGFGLPWGGFALTFGGQTFGYLDVEREAMRDLEELILAEAPSFIGKLNRREAPLPEGGARALELLKRLYPTSSTRRVAWVAPFTMDGETYHPEAWDEARQYAIEQRRAWEEECKKLDAVLYAVAQDAGFVQLASGVGFSFVQVDMPPLEAKSFRRVYRRVPRR